MDAICSKSIQTAITKGHIYAAVVNHTMMKYSLKKGLTFLKKAGEEVISKDLVQFHERENFEPQETSKLRKDQHKGALESLMCLKEKLNEKVKVHQCADRRKPKVVMVTRS
jgi:hypothetical protein